MPRARPVEPAGLDLRNELSVHRAEAHGEGVRLARTLLVVHLSHPTQTGWLDETWDGCIGLGPTAMPLSLRRAGRPPGPSLEGLAAGLAGAGRLAT